MLESFGAIEFGGKDEDIEAGLVDEGHHLISAGGRGVTFGYIPLAYIVYTAFRANLYPNPSATPLHKTSVLPARYQDTDGNELQVSENPNSVHTLLIFK